MLFTMMPTTIFSLGANESLPVMMAFDYRSSGDFHSNLYYNKIYSATVLDEIDKDAVAGAVDSWDISAAGDGSVMAWVYLNAEATAAATNVPRYDLYIGGDGGVAVNPNSGCLFYFLSALEVVDARHLDTRNATTLVGMFENCYKLREVNITGWNTDNLTSMENMFRNCYEIETLDLSSFNTSKVTTMRFAFYNCKKLNYIYAGDGWSIKSIANLYDGVFNCCYAKFGVTEEQYKIDVQNGKQYDASVSKATYQEGGYLTYKAPEAIAEYKVTYEIKGSVRPETEITIPEAAIYEEGTTVIVADIPSVDGYVFSGWVTENNADIKDGEFVIHNDVHFVGSWVKVYKVNYEYREGYDVPDGAAGQLPADKDYKANDIVLVESVPFVNGYVFEGWTTDDVEVESDKFIMPAQDVTLYGYFRKPVESIVVNDGNSSITIKEDKTEFIHIFVNGESSSTDGVEFKSNDESIVKVDENGKLTPVRTGETTVTVKSKDNEDIQVTIRVVVEKYKVTYKFVGSIPEEAILPVDNNGYSSNDRVERAENPIAKGYTFLGWEPENDNVTVDEYGKFSMPDEDVLFVGKWIKKTAEDIVVDKNNVELEVGYTDKIIITVKPDDVIDKDVIITSSDETVVKVDNEGNITAVGDGTAIITVASKDDPAIKEEITVTVKKPIVYYSVTYKYVGDVPAGAPAVPGGVTYVAGTEVAVNAEPTLEGYTFSGWSTDDATVADGKFILNSNVEFVGSWTKIPEYKVTYKYEGVVPVGAPSVPGEKTYKADVVVNVNDAPTFEGYTFSGWSTKDTALADGKFTMPAKDVVLVGSWTKLAPGPVTSITAPDKITVVLGEEVNIGATVNSNAANKKLNYVSDNEAVARVEADGTIITNGEGKAYITIISVDNPSVYKIIEVTVTAKPEAVGKHYMVFGKTEKIGWYTVSFDGGETWQTVFGNSNHVVDKGTEVIIKANDVFGDPFTFYINGQAVTPDENGYVRVVVDQYVLVGALGIPVIAPDAEEGLSWIQQIIQAIKDFFAKIKSWFTK